MRASQTVLPFNKMGRERYPTADRLMITADGGGSNGTRETGRAITPVRGAIAIKARVMV